MDKTTKDYYLILQVHMLAEQQVIKAAYKKLGHKYHPDNNGDQTLFQNIREAYQVLSDPTRRREYDKQWRNNKLSSNPIFDDNMATGYYDIAFSTVKEVVVEYMYYIMNGEYQMAYELLSEYNKKQIFKKDFVLWQSLIGEIHRLKKFDCVIADFNVDIESNEQMITYKVKITEMNLLLNRIEEDYFKRYVIYEKGIWKILLPDINIKGITKKYKKIIAISRKNRKKIKGISIKTNEIFNAKVVTMSTFINNCEYEYLRFMRYKRNFSVIKLQIDTKELTLAEENYFEKILETYTRKLDSFSRFDQNTFLILLPETDVNGGSNVINKLDIRIREQLDSNIKLGYHQKLYTLDKTYIGIKEFLDKITTDD